MDKISTFISTYFDWFYITVPGTVDIIEILILSFFIYRIMLWFKQSRAWTLLKGIVMIVLFTAIAAVFQFNTILYLLKNAFSVGIIAVVRAFRNCFFTGGVVEGNGICSACFLRKHPHCGVASWCSTGQRKSTRKRLRVPTHRQEGLQVLSLFLGNSALAGLEVVHFLIGFID